MPAVRILLLAYVSAVTALAGLAEGLIKLHSQPTSSVVRQPMTQYQKSEIEVKTKA